MRFFSAIKYRGQNKRPLRFLKTEYTAHMDVIIAIGTVRWDVLPRGASDTYQHICVIHCVASLSAEYEKNEEAFQEYYNKVEICQSSSAAHFKAAMQIRNREMVDRADLVLCYIERKSGGAYQTVLHAKKQNKQIINLVGGMTTFCE